jgi:large subunit ribosomal protein L3
MESAQRPHVPRLQIPSSSRFYGGRFIPGRVFKIKKLPGRMGNERVTVANLEVVKVDAERNLLLIKGALPGSRGTLLTIKETVKNKS